MENSTPFQNAVNLFYDNISLRYTHGTLAFIRIYELYPSMWNLLLSSLSACARVVMFKDPNKLIYSI